MTALGASGGATAPATREQRFFRRVRLWTWIKHTILADYFVPWAMKVGSSAPEIFVIDAFAGAGSYKDALTGETRDGSPVIAALRAQEYARRRPGKSMRVIAVERDRTNYEALVRRVGGFSELVIVRHGSFITHVDEITQIVGNAPVLVLLDPIGLKQINAAACKRLLDRPGKTDAFVIVDFQIVHRTAGQLLSDGAPNPAIAGSAANAANIDAFFDGSARWREIATSSRSRSAREQAYLDLYFAEVLSGRFDRMCVYPVKPRYDGPVKYWIVQASSHIDALLLMNDEIVKVDQELYLRTYADENALPGIAESLYAAEMERRHEALEKEILELVVKAGAAGTTFGAVTSELLPRYFGLVKQGRYSRVTKTLVRDGEVKREQRAAAKLKEDERLWTAPTSN